MRSYSNGWPLLMGVRGAKDIGDLGRFKPMGRQHPRLGAKFRPQWQELIAGKFYA